tara:strand:- start:102 stop:677 length:576 start_codon:yes stop_codon:yes gene_type:complete
MAKKETITEIREKPGMSNAGKYKNVKAKDFCGPNGTYPVNTLKRAKAALSYSKFASDPGDIVSCVNKKYPELAKKDSDDKKKKAPTAYGSGPLFNTDKEEVEKAKQNLKDAKQAKREYRRSKPYKKYEGGEYQYENRSEFKGSMAEERDHVKSRREELREARKNKRNLKRATRQYNRIHTDFLREREKNQQ